MAQSRLKLTCTKNSRPPVDLLITDRAEKALSDSGFIPLSPLNKSGNLVFFSNSSVQQPANYDGVAARINAKLSSMMQYILCVSRFAHYIKVMGRDRIGSYATPQACERDLQSWINNYTTASDSASDEVRSRYPLSSARVNVKEHQAKPGHYYSVMQLQPHFQLDQMVSSIKLVTELSPSLRIRQIDRITMKEIFDYIQQGKLLEAISYCEQQLKDDPVNFDIRSQFIELLCLNNELERADKQLDYMVQKNPDFAVGAMNLRQLVRAEQARQDFYQGKAAPKLFHDNDDLDAIFLELRIALNEGDSDTAQRLAKQLEERRANPTSDQ